MVSQAFVDVSVSLIIVGVRKYEQVPVTIREEVKVALAALGRGTDGKPIAASE